MPFFESTDGTRLAFEDYGSGPPIVFAPSVMLSTDMWEYQIPYLVERGYRCVAMDWRGHGRSDRPPTGYDFDTLTDDLATLLDHLDLDEVALVGHSMGGAVAARCAARRSADRVSCLVLISAMLPMLRQTEDNQVGIPDAAWEATKAMLQSDRPRWLSDQASVFFATHLGPPTSPYLVDWVIRECEATAPYAVLTLQSQVFHTDHRDVVAELAVPTLVVHGAADFSAPVEVTGRRTAELLPDATYKEYPTAGHGIFVSHHEELNADLLAFIEKYGSASYAGAGSPAEGAKSTTPR